MSTLASLRLVQFRNIEEANLEFAPGVNVFVGRNAQGKTNLLESILYVATATTPRTNRQEDLIRKGQKTAYGRGVLIRDGEEVLLEFGLERGKKRIKLNGSVLAPIRNLYGIMRVVFFAPEDLDLVSGPPSGRRRYLDMAISQLEPEHIDLLQRYQRAMKQRNQLLRRLAGKGEDLAASKELDAWDAPCARLGAAIVATRTRLLETLAPFVSAAYERLAGHGLKLDYAGEVWNRDAKQCEEMLGIELYARRMRDAAQAVTGAGPHRDDLRLRVGERGLRSFGSQGERRTAALALRLGELELQRQRTGVDPILLVDDVIYEMDGTRRERFLEALRGEGQVFFTVTDLAQLGSLANHARVFTVEDGKVVRAG